MTLLQFIHQSVSQFNDSFKILTLGIISATQFPGMQGCLLYPLNLIFHLQKAFNQMKLLLIVFKNLIRPCNQVVDTLPADTLLGSDLAQGKIFADRCFINIFLMIGQQLAIKIKEQRSTQNIVHAAHYIDALYVCQVFFLDSLNNYHGISE